MPALHLVGRPRASQLSSGMPALLGKLFEPRMDPAELARSALGGELVSFAELSQALIDIDTGKPRRAIQTYVDSEAWEVGIEGVERDVLITVFQPTTPCIVASYGKRLPFRVLVDRLGAILSELDKGAGPESAQRERHPEFTAGLLATYQASIASLRTTADAFFAPPAPMVKRSAEAASDHFKLASAADFRKAAIGPRAESRQVERSDLHSLLLPGRLELKLGGRSLIGRCFPIAIAEQLLALADEVLSAEGNPRALMRQVRLGDVLLEVRRVSSKRALELRATRAATLELAAKYAFASVEGSQFVATAAAFCTRLAEAFEDTDPEQRYNLRLRRLRDRASAFREHAAEDTREASFTNPAPEQLSRFAPPPSMNGDPLHDAVAQSWRYQTRWVAQVPELDLQASFLCGERLVIGSSKETACLARHSGAILWRIKTNRASVLVAPPALVRVEPAGEVRVYDVVSGRQRFGLRIAPRPTGGPSGCIVHAPGLPKLLALAEGDRSVAGIDLISGELRWRYSARRPTTCRLRRLGRLLVLIGGDPTVVALDVTTGDVVWRLADDLGFSSNLAFDGDSLFTLSGGPTTSWRLSQLGAWTGERRWATALEERPIPGLAPLVTDTAVVVPIATRQGAGALGFARRDGSPLWRQPPGLVSSASSWLAVDDAILVNSRAGTLVCLDAPTGQVRYTSAFGKAGAGDQPKCLEPVLRNGALFIPQREVYVVRPHDGSVLGTVPAELIPDFVRVDERCDVYVAEASGHLAAFGLGPRLRLVGGAGIDAANVADKVDQLGHR